VHVSLVALSIIIVLIVIGQYVLKV